MQPKLLCGIDFSPAAVHACQYAYALAQHLHAQLCVCHVFHEGSLEAGAPPDLVDAMQRHDLAAGQAAMEAVVGTWLASPPGAQWEAVLRGGEPAPELAALAASLPAQLLVMGATPLNEGASGWVDSWLGKESTHLLRYATRPLLVVPAGCQFEPPRHIVAGAELHEGRFSFPADLVAWLRPWEARISCVHVIERHALFPEQEAAYTSGIHQLRRAGLDARFHLQHDAFIEDGLQQFADAHDAQLLLVIKRPASFIERIIEGSVSRELVLRTERPLLVWLDESVST
ncbi:MAG: hypothetical protein OHK0039_42800 [Bacteroidia bacterium]